MDQFSDFLSQRKPVTEEDRRKLRRDAGLTTERLALLTGLARRTIVRWEQGRASLSIEKRINTILAPMSVPEPKAEPTVCDWCGNRIADEGKDYPMPIHYKYGQKAIACQACLDSFVDQCLVQYDNRWYRWRAIQGLKYPGGKGWLEEKVLEPKALKPEESLDPPVDIPLKGLAEHLQKPDLE